MSNEGLNVALPREAVITAVVFVETGDVVIVNVAEVAPAAIVTVTGVTPLEESELNVTARPPVGAAA